MTPNEIILDTEKKEIILAEAKPEAAEKKKAPAQRKRTAKKPKVVLTKARRKRAVARARLRSGAKKITLNRQDISTVKPREIRELILEPVNVSGLTRDIAENADISIAVHGGGAVAQAQAARTALAKAIAGAAQSDVVRKQFMQYDRSLLIDDVRQVEPKKYKGPKARARFQKSYR